MLLHLRLLADRGSADDYDQRLHWKRMVGRLLFRADVHAKQYASMVEELQRDAL
jgi:hypothetical protein